MRACENGAGRRRQSVFPLEKRSSCFRINPKDVFSHSGPIGQPVTVMFKRSKPKPRRTVYSATRPGGIENGTGMPISAQIA